MTSSGSLDPRCSTCGRYRVWRRNEAHAIANAHPISELSLATRVCRDWVLSEGAEIAASFAEVDEYLSKGGTTGTIMATLALLAWYWCAARHHRTLLCFPATLLTCDGSLLVRSTIAIEFNSTFDSLHITFSLPMAATTKICKKPDGCYTMEALAEWRVAARIAVRAVLRRLPACCGGDVQPISPRCAVPYMQP